jgi:hypothetical protein
MPRRRSRTRRLIGACGKAATARTSRANRQCRGRQFRRWVGAKRGQSPAYQDWTKADQVKRARQIGIKGWSSMSKSQLIKAMRNR